MGDQIPKIIHYVWLGKSEKTEMVRKCILSWKKYCPFYEIKEWNEENIIRKHPLIEMAIKAKNWALASDIIRTQALIDEGGIYLDTDVELLRPLDEFLKYDAVLCYESKYWLGSAVLMSKKEHPLFKRVYQRYDVENKISFNTNALTVHAYTAVMRTDYGLRPTGKTQVIDHIGIFSEDYFYPKNYMTQQLKLTQNSFAVHYYGSTWHNKSQKKGALFAYYARKLLGKSLFRIFEKMVSNSYFKKINKQYLSIGNQKNG